MTNYQKYCINDIYGEGNQHFLDNADTFYKTHNIIKGGIEVSDKVSTVNNMHTISNTYINYNSEIGEEKPYERKDFKFYPLMSIPETLYINNSHKLISAKDIDFENAYLKYAANQQSEYKDIISYTDVYINESTGQPVIEHYTTDSYIFNREITPYINNTYDLLNIVDYLFNRMNCFHFLIEYVKKQHTLLDIK